MWVSQGCEALYCTVQYITLKVHKIENSFGSDFEFCTISLLVQILRFCKKILIGPLLEEIRLFEFSLV